MERAFFGLLLALPLATSGQIITTAGSANADPGYSISGTISPASSGNGTSVNLTGLTPALVQSAPGEVAVGDTTATFHFGAPSQPGDTIVLFTRFGGTTISSITDDQPGGSNIYTSVLGPTPWGVFPESTDRWAQVFVAKNSPGGSILTITVKLAGTSTHDTYIAALEYSGVDPVNPVNATAFGTGTVPQNGAPATGNLTTTVANAELVATSWDSNESYTATGNGAGYTTDTAAGIMSLAGGSGWPNLTEYRAAPTPGSWNATASSQPNVDQWAIQLIALAPPSQNTTVDTSGDYTFNNVANGTYTITPSKPGITFTPSSRTATVNGANVSGVNFTVLAGTPGAANCVGESVSALAQEFGGLNNAAAALGYSNVAALQHAIRTFCGP
jgi:hypothetical protein